MAEYVAISKAEFEKELRAIEKELVQDETLSCVVQAPFKILPLDDTNEYVYAVRIVSRKNPKRPLTLRIYSSITASGAARSKGQDAIRVNVVTYRRLIENPAWKRALGQAAARGVPEWIPERIYAAVKGKRVHRVAGWRKNLRTRILEVIKEVY